MTAQLPEHTTLAAPRRALSFRVASRKWLPDLVCRWIFGKPLAPTREEWQQMLDALWQGDPAMDGLVAWMFEGNARDAKALFEQALERGIASIEDPPAALSQFFAQVETPPAWLDRDLLDQGARAARANGMVNYYVLRDMALMGGYVYFNSMNQTLAATGALEKNVARRLGETGKWLDDVTKPNGLDRFGAGFVTTIRVRMVHSLIRRALQKGGSWDAQAWGIPINQCDMLATYLAFGPATLTGSRLFGVLLSKQEKHAVVHMWRYIGWLSGVSEPLLALSEGEGLRKLYHALLTHRSPDKKVRELGMALLNEPLTRLLPRLAAYPFLTRLVRRYLYHKHLSNSAAILGPIQRYRLGVPMWAVPWYPLLSAPFRFLRLTWCRWRGDRALEKLAARNDERQRALLASYFDGGEATIIHPAADHPAHVD